MTTKRPPSPATPDLPPITPTSLARARHQRICTICHHEDRYWIEQDFLHWVSPPEIARHYELPDRFTVYRHAHALGLFALRKRKLRSALEFVIESADRVQPTAAGPVCAIRAYARITDDGEWIDTPKHVIFSHETVSVYPEQGQRSAPKRRHLSVGASATRRTVPADGPSHAPTDEPALDDSPSTEPRERALTAAAVQEPQNWAELPLSQAEATPEAAPSSVQLPASSFRPLTPLAHKIARMNAQLETAMSRAEGGGDT
ncbi:MAG: hypothetical protein WBC04_21500 [Candidatus Acidiferrales bacterium]